MKIPIKKIISQHNKTTGEKVTREMIAEEMVKEGLFKNVSSAQGMITYNMSGRAKSLDFALLEFLKRRFNLTNDDILN